MGRYKDIVDALDLSKHLERAGYKIDKRVFRGALFLILGLVAVSVYLDGASIVYPGKFYYECLPESMTNCNNPVYGMCEQFPGVCQLETLTPGSSIGEKISSFSESLSLLAVLVVVCAFGINHLWHNRRFRG